MNAELVVVVQSTLDTSSSYPGTLLCVYNARVHTAGNRSGPFFSRVSSLISLLGYSLNSHFLWILLRDDQRFQKLWFFIDFLVPIFRICFHFSSHLPSPILQFSATEFPEFRELTTWNHNPQIKPRRKSTTTTRRLRLTPLPRPNLILDRVHMGLSPIVHREHRGQGKREHL